MSGLQNTIVRPAALDDLPRLEIMGARFFEASGLDRWFTYRPLCFSQVCVNFMTNGQAVILVGEGAMGAVGMAAALAYPCWFDEDHLTAQELFWWVEPAHRGGLMGTELRQGLEDWARGKGCRTMEMGALEASRPEALAALYERKGYGPKERIFCKRLA